MGLRFSTKEEVVAVYDSVTDWAFGPIFYTEEAAQAFLDWAESEGVKGGDVRALTNGDLYDLWHRYAGQVEDARGMP